MVKIHGVCLRGCRVGGFLQTVIVRARVCGGLWSPPWCGMFGRTPSTRVERNSRETTLVGLPGVIRENHTDTVWADDEQGIE